MYSETNYFFYIVYMIYMPLPLVVHIAITLLAACLLIVATGCAQQYAGIARVEIEYSEAGIARLYVITGRQVETVDLLIDQAGVVEVSARNIQAFEGQAVRGQVEQALIEHGIQPTADLISAILGQPSNQ